MPVAVPEEQRCQARGPGIAAVAVGEHFADPRVEGAFIRARAPARTAALPAPTRHRGSDSDNDKDSDNDSASPTLAAPLRGAELGACDSEERQRISYACCAAPRRRARSLRQRRATRERAVRPPLARLLLAIYIYRIVADEKRTVLIVLFIPSVERDGTTPVEQERWVTAALEAFGTLFGGATAFPKGRGVWRDSANEGKLVSTSRWCATATRAATKSRTTPSSICSASSVVGWARERTRAR